MDECHIFLAAFYEKAEINQDDKKPNHLIIAMTSDRGLCGSVHTNIIRAIKAAVPNKPAGTDFKIVAIGDKSRNMLSRYVQLLAVIHIESRSCHYFQCDEILFYLEISLVVKCWIMC